MEDTVVLAVMGTSNFSEICARVLKEATIIFNEWIFEGKKLLNWESQLQVSKSAEIKIPYKWDWFAKLSLEKENWDWEAGDRQGRCETAFLWLKHCSAMQHLLIIDCFRRCIPLTILCMISPDYNSHKVFRIDSSVSITGTGKTF